MRPRSASLFAFLLVLTTALLAQVSGPPVVTQYPGGQGSGSQQKPGQPGAAQAAEAPKPTGSIEGQVLTQDGDRPVRKASIEAFEITARLGTANFGPGNPQRVETDAEGRFLLKELAPGRYSVSVSHPLYIGSGRMGRGASMTVTLADKQELKDIVFRLLPAAVIRGRVTDEDGDPVPRAMVQALRSQYMRGRKLMMPAGSAQTDDLGEFRIHSLGAGSYLVSADRGFMGPGQDTRATRQYVRTYFPNTIEQANAAPVVVKNGDEVPVTISLMKQDTVLVKGTVVGASGEKPSAGQVRIFPSDDMPFMSGFTGMLREGSFEVRVPPGRYRVMAMIVGAEPGLASTVTTTVDVPAQGLENVKLTATGTAAGKVVATVRVEGVQNVDVSGLMLGLRVKSDDAFGVRLPGEAGSGRASKEGVVEIPRLNAGTYEVSYFNVGRGLEDGFLKAVIQGTRDVTQSGARVSGAETHIEVVISAAAGRIEGTVEDGDHHPVKSAMIVAVPDAEYRSREDYYRTASSDQNGRFVLRGVRPGRYTLLALEDPDSGIWMVPEFLRKVEPSGASISIGEKEQKQAQLKLIPAGEVAAATGQ